MSLNNILQKGKSIEQLKIVLYGEEKVGKSTFAAGAPKAIFLDVEGGTNFLDVARIHRDNLPTFDSIMNTIDMLIEEDHQFSTLNVDSIDWVQERACEKIAEENNARSYRDNKNKNLAYGVGTDLVFMLMKNFISKLEQLRTQRRMNIILIAHCKVKHIDEPTGSSYDKYVPKLLEQVEGYCKEWADFILFAKKPIQTYKDSSDSERRKSKVNNNEPILFTDKNGSYVGGGRVPLPDELPLTWSAFSSALKDSLGISKPNQAPRIEKPASVTLSNDDEIVVPVSIAAAQKSAVTEEPIIILD